MISKKLFKWKRVVGFFRGEERVLGLSGIEGIGAVWRRVEGVGWVL